MTVTPKLTVNYGIRYEIYPAPYTDKHALFVWTRPGPKANIQVGGVGETLKTQASMWDMGQVTLRFGVAYRIDDRTVIRSASPASPPIPRVPT